jgi:hypothetical protein
MKIFINIYVEEILIMKKSNNSLEDAIRAVHNKHKNKPSPLLFANRDVPMVPQQQGTPPTADIRSHLLSGFVPKQDTFR